MKTIVRENTDGYTIDMKAETMEEATILVRMGINATKELLFCETYASDTISSCIGIGIRKRKKCTVPKAR